MSTTLDRPQLNTDELVEKFIQLRDRRDELRKQQQEELAKYQRCLDYLEGILLDRLREAGAQHIATPHGTAAKSVQTSCTVLDWPATLTYIQEHEAWDLLEARVSKTAAVQVITETKAPIPGVQLSQRLTINVRRPSK